MRRRHAKHIIFSAAAFAALILSCRTVRHTSEETHISATHTVGAAAQYKTSIFDTLFLLLPDVPLSATELKTPGVHSGTFSLPDARPSAATAAAIRHTHLQLDVSTHSTDTTKTHTETQKLRLNTKSNHQPSSHTKLKAFILAAIIANLALILYMLRDARRAR